MTTTLATNDMEQQLMADMLSGSRRAFQCLYARYAPALLGVIHKVAADRKMAEDLLQKAFIELWARRAEYNAATQRPFTWMLKVTRTLALNTVNPLHINDNDTENLNAVTIVYDTGERMAGNGLTSGQAGKAILLGPKEQAVLELMYCKGRTVTQVSETLHCTTDEVKTILKSAMNKFKPVQHG